VSSPKNNLRYIKNSRLGTGSYAVVYNVNDVKRGHNVAMKVYKTDVYQDEGVNETILRELATIKKINHPNLISMLDYGQDFTYFTSHIYQTDLRDYYITTRKESKAWINQVITITHQILKGIYCMHSNGLMHRDFKPDNIMVQCDGSNNNNNNNNNGGLRIVIIDMGLSRKVDTYNQSHTKTTQICTLWYKSPETMYDHMSYGYGLDMWSVGCTVGELILGKVLFTGTNELDQLSKIFDLMGTPDHKIHNTVYFSPRKSHFNKTFYQIAGTKLYNLLENLLVLNPTNRLMSHQALNHGIFCQLSTEKVTDFRVKSIDNLMLQIIPPVHLGLLQQPLINSYHRESLLHWLIEVCDNQNLSMNTYIRAQGILDRYILTTVNNSITIKNFQLIGMASVWIAAKLYETFMVEVETLIYLAADSYTISELMNMEINILKTLDLDLYFPTSFDFISYYVTQTNLTLSEISKVENLLVCASFSYDLVVYHPSTLCLTACEYIKYVDKTIDNHCMRALKHHLEYVRNKEFSDVVTQVLKTFL
jgi:serine/threonine protein kinase